MSVPNTGFQGYQRHVVTLFQIPVSVSAWYLVMVWVILIQAASFESGLVDLIVLTSGVLLHELGHGLVARRYNLFPTITLHAFGGWCVHSQARTRKVSMQVVAGGPAASFALALLGYVLHQALPATSPWWLLNLAWSTYWLNLFWGVLNIFPVRPLDGGQLLHGWLLGRYKADKADEIADNVAIVAAIIGIGAGVAMGVLLMSGLYAWFGWQAWQRRYGPGYDRSNVSGYSRPGGSYSRPRSYGDRGGDVEAAQQSPIQWPPPIGTRNLMVGVLATWTIEVLAKNQWGLELMEGLQLTSEGMRSGEVWRALTYVVALDPGAWRVLLYAIGGLFFFGQTVERSLGQRGFYALLGAGWLAGGLLAATLSLIPLPVFAQPVFGASSVVATCALGWAALQPDEVQDALFQIRVPIRRVVTVVLAADTLFFFLGAEHAWPLHMAGAAVGWYGIKHRHRWLARVRQRAR